MQNSVEVSYLVCFQFNSFFQPLPRLQFSGCSREERLLSILELDDQVKYGSQLSQHFLSEKKPAKNK